MNRGLKKALVLCAAVVALVAVFAVSAMATDYAVTSQFPALTIRLPVAQSKNVEITKYISTNIIEGAKWGAVSSAGTNPDNGGWTLSPVYNTTTVNGVTITRGGGSVTTFNTTSVNLTAGQSITFPIKVYDNLAEDVNAYPDCFLTVNVTVEIVADTVTRHKPLQFVVYDQAANAVGGKNLTEYFANAFTFSSSAPSPGYVIGERGTSTTAGETPVTTDLVRAIGNSMTFNAMGSTVAPGQIYRFSIDVYDNLSGAVLYDEVPVKITIVNYDPEVIVNTTFADPIIEIPVSAANAGHINIISHVNNAISWGETSNPANRGALFGANVVAFTEDMTQSKNVRGLLATNAASVKVGLVRASAEVFNWNSNDAGGGYTVFAPDYAVKNNLQIGDQFSYAVTIYDNLAGAGVVGTTGIVTVKIVADPAAKEYPIGENYLTANVYASAIDTQMVLRLDLAATAIGFDTTKDTAAGVVTYTINGYDSVAADRWVAGRYYYRLPSTLTPGQELIGEFAYPDASSVTKYVRVKLTVVANPAAAANAAAAISSALTIEQGDTTEYFITTTEAGYKGSYRGAHAWNDAVASFKGTWIPETKTLNVGSTKAAGVLTAKGYFAGGGASTTIKYGANADATPGTDTPVKLAFTLTTTADGYGFLVGNNYCIIDVAATIVPSTPAPVSTTVGQREAKSGTPDASDVTFTSALTEADYTGFTILEVGTLVIKESTLGAGTLDIDNADATKIECTYLNDSTAGKYKLVAAVWDIPDDAVGAKIVAVAYVAYDDGGVTKYAYGPQVTATVA